MQIFVKISEPFVIDRHPCNPKSLSDNKKDVDVNCHRP